MKHKQITQQLAQIIANGPPQRVATRAPQRVTAPSTSVDITAPETIHTSNRVHQRRRRSNTLMSSIIEERINAGRVCFNLPPQGRVEKNSDNLRPECLVRSGKHEAKTPNNHSLRQSNPQVIPDKHKQTSARYASRKTIQRLIDEIQMEKDNLPSRNTKAGSIPIRCQMDEELRRRKLKNKKAAKFETHPNNCEDAAFLFFNFRRRNSSSI